MNVQIEHNLEEMKVSLREALPEIAEIVQSAIDSNFEERGPKNESAISLSDGGMTPWKPLAASTKIGYARKKYVLERTLARSGGGLASAVTVQIAGDAVEVSVNKKYAAMQQFGGTVNVPVTTMMRKYFWAMYYESKQTEEFYKNMALTKKEKFTITIPPSPYLYLSADAVADIEECIERFGKVE